MKEIEGKNPEEPAGVEKVRGIVGEIITRFKISQDVQALVRERMGEILGPIASKHPEAWGLDAKGNNETAWEVREEVGKLFHYDHEANKMGPILQLRAELRSLGVNPTQATMIVDYTMQDTMYVLESGFTSYKELIAFNRAKAKRDMPEKQKAVSAPIPIFAEGLAVSGQRHTRWEGEHQDATSKSLYFSDLLNTY